MPATAPSSRALSPLLRGAGLTLPLAVLAGLVGCSGSEGDGGPVATTGGPTTSQGPGKEPSAEELGGRRDALVIAELSDADSLLYAVSQSASDSALISNLNMDNYEATFDCSLQYGPALYESWSWDDTHTILKVKLREGVSWSDGKPVTAHDLKFTYDLVLDPVVASPRQSMLEKMVVGKAPLVIDDYNVEFHYQKAYNTATMLQHAGLAPSPKHILESADRASLRGNDFHKNPTTTGPWRIDKWEPDSRIVLVPNEKFTGPKEMSPRLNRIIFKIIPEYATRLVELESGAIDLMTAILPSDAARLKKSNPELSFYRRGWRSNDYIAWNNFDSADYKAQKETAKENLDWSKVKRHPIFGDVAARRALTKAIDIDKLIKDLLTTEDGEVYGRRAVSTVTPALCETHNNDITLIPLNVAEAKAELEAQGWKDTNNDGVLDRDGKPFRFTLLTNSGNARRNKAAVIVQDNLKAIGVDMQIEQVESNTFFERLRKKDYEAALSGWSANLAPDMNPMWHSGEKYEFNFTGYSNPQVDQLIADALEEPDDAKSNAMLKEAQRLVYEDQPYTFLYWMDEIVAVHSRFKDVRVDILSQYRRMDAWWVPANEVKYPQ